MYPRRIWCFAVLILLFANNITPVTSITKAQPEGWSEDTRLTFTNGRSQNPAIAVEGDNVHVVYADEEGGGYYDLFLWYINSSDCGTTWNSPICLVNNTPLRVNSPKIAVHGNNLHVIWSDFNTRRLYYIQSTDNGNSWSNERVLTPMIYSFMSNWEIGMNGNTVHVVYINSDNKLTYIFSNDNGVNWSTPRVLLQSITKLVESAISVNGDNIHIAFRVTWKKMGKLNSDILYVRSTDNGANWDTPIDISTVPGNDTSTTFPDIAVVDNDIFVVFRDEGPGGTRQIFYSYSNDNGATWYKRIRLSNSTPLITSPVVHPHIAIENDNIYIVWDDYRNVTEGSWELYYKSSFDRGITWSIDTRLTNAPEPTISSDIQIYEDVVHVVWWDSRDGNEEVYYKQMLIPKPVVSAVVDIKPDTLNLKSKGNWITAYIELPDGYDVNDINISTVLLNYVIPAESSPTEVGDYDNDGIPDIMIKFDRSDVEDYIDIPMNSVTLIITGYLITSELFEGSDIIRAILPP
jgi:hypothetical protein